MRPITLLLFHIHCTYTCTCNYMCIKLKVVRTVPLFLIINIVRTPSHPRSSLKDTSSSAAVSFSSISASTRAIMEESSARGSVGMMSIRWFLSLLEYLNRAGGSPERLTVWEEFSRSWLQSYSKKIRQHKNIKGYTQLYCIISDPHFHIQVCTQTTLTYFDDILNSRCC